MFHELNNFMFNWIYILAISFGAKDIHLQTVWAAILNYDPKLTQHQIIYELRLPRVIGAAVVGQLCGCWCCYARYNTKSFS